MKNLYSILIFVITLLQITPVTACFCSRYWSFCEGTDANSKIVEVEVLEKYNITSQNISYMDIKIIEILQGNISEEMVSLINHGTSCDVSFDRFEIGEKFVLRFTELESKDSISNYSTFHFGVCSISFLKLEGNNIIGNIEPDVKSKDYNEFKNDIGQCTDLTLFDRNPKKLNDFIYTYPNPTYDRFSISFSILNPEEISIELFSPNGQLINSTSDISQNNLPLDLNQLAQGVYFLKVTYRNNSIVKRIIKL